MDPIDMLILWLYSVLKSQLMERAARCGVTEDGLSPAEHLTETEQKQREQLWAMVEQGGFGRVMEETVSIWFRQLFSLRVMEANGLLPFRVLSGRNGKFHPEILNRFTELNWKGLDIPALLELKRNRQREELYRRLILAQCNELHQRLPGLFPPPGDCSELLLPDDLLQPDGVAARFVEDIPENICQLTAKGWHGTRQAEGTFVGRCVALWTGTQFRETPAAGSTGRMYTGGR